MSETEEFEKIIANAWFSGIYTDSQIKLVCETQGVDFDRVQDLYGLSYEEQEKKGALKWN